VILTQHGWSAAVLLDVEAYEGLLDELALLRDIRTAEAQIQAGEGLGQTAGAREVRTRLRA
jgi:PHD/YefM family antitoxin component YafN of YafNO toxin-antitoxin module